MNEKVDYQRNILISYSSSPENVTAMNTDYKITQEKPKPSHPVKILTQKNT